MNIDKNALRKAAEAATPSKWIHLFGDRFVYTRLEDGCRGIPVVGVDYPVHSKQDGDNLHYIAAANPVTIIALLDEIAALVADKAALVDALNSACVLLSSVDGIRLNNIRNLASE